MELSQEFRKRFFSELFRKYPTKILAKKYPVSRCMLYNYKNGTTSTISESLLKDFSGLLKIPEDEVNKNIIKVIDYNDIVNKALLLGREERKNRIQKAKSEIISVEEITVNDVINVEKWFLSYKNLTETCFRKIRSIKRGNKIILSYNNYSRGVNKPFIVNIPAKIMMDNDFQYFFGLWCGDRAGGGRVGILNKQEELILFTEKYLKKIYQSPKFVLMQAHDSNAVPPFDLRIDEKVKVKNMKGSYVVSVFSVNGILKSFFDVLYDNLDYILRMLPNKNVFFAGLFDAEGNVFLEDGAFRWSCCSARNVEIYKKHLSQFRLFERYDGSSLITRNAEAFSKYILPHIKHEKKANDSNMLISGEGRLNERFLGVLKLVGDNPGMTQTQLSSIIGRKKLYSQLRFLNRLGYIYHLEYPRRFCIAQKGVLEVNGYAHPD